MGYTAAQLKNLRDKGHAMAPTPAAAKAGKPASYPVETAGDLDSAIHLARTPAQRAFVKKRAAAMGLSSKIPEDWG
jgi:hypothetical protein